MKLYDRLGMTLDEFKSHLERRLLADASMVEIAGEMNVTPAAIHAWMKKFNIRRRQELRSKEWLEEQYLTNLRSAEEIAEQLGVSPPAITWYLDKHRIPRRNRSEAQILANKKRLISPLHQYGSFRSRGYCCRFKGLYCRSISELLWLIEHESDFDRISWEPFVFQNHRPDALLDNVVYEIKVSRSALSDETFDHYQKLGIAIKESMGYEYQLVFMRDQYPKKYRDLLAEAKDRGMNRGQEGPAIDWV